MSMGSQSIRPLSLPSDPPSSETSRTREMVRVQGESYSYKCPTRIGVLSDDVLLDIFDFYRKNHDYFLCIVWEWHLLVHVCRRWRQIVFGSPRRLNLQIHCTSKTPVRKSLGIWPAFPIVIDYGRTAREDHSQDDITAALEHPDRVCRIGLPELMGSQLAELVTVMQVPFPVLTYLDISTPFDDSPVLPSRFLGGSAPCLQELQLYDITYPSLPTLLLTANNLINLTLAIPQAGYISPEAIVVGLAALPKLETLLIEYGSPSRQIRCPRVTRIVLPALTSFNFLGFSEYLEKLVAQMDCPQLNCLLIEYFEELVDVLFAELPKFVDLSVGPRLTLFKHTDVSFSSDCISFTTLGWLPHQRPTITFDGGSSQASRIAEWLGKFFATEIFSNVVHLNLRGRQDLELEGMDDVEWLHLLHRFSAVQTLHVSQGLAGYVALALEDITWEVATEVLPSLNLICLAGQSASSVWEFIAVREVSDRPVTFVDTMTKFCKRLDSESSVEFYTRTY